MRQYVVTFYGLTDVVVFVLNVVDRYHVNNYAENVDLANETYQWHTGTHMAKRPKVVDRF